MLNIHTFHTIHNALFPFGNFLQKWETLVSYQQVINKLSATLTNKKNMLLFCYGDTQKQINLNVSPTKQLSIFFFHL